MPQFQIKVIKEWMYIHRGFSRVMHLMHAEKSNGRYFLIMEKVWVPGCPLEGYLQGSLVFTLLGIGNNYSY